MLKNRRFFMIFAFILVLCTLSTLTALAYDGPTDKTITKTTAATGQWPDDDRNPRKLTTLYAFGGTADFWESRIGTVNQKPGNDVTCYRYFGTGHGFYLYSTAKNSSDKIVSAKTKMGSNSYYDVNYVDNKPGKGHEIRLTGAREYWLDSKSSVKGAFYP